MRCSTAARASPCLVTLIALTGVAAAIEAVTARINAATAAADAQGTAYDKARHSLEDQVKAAATVTKQAEARAAVEQRIVDLTLARAAAGGQLNQQDSLLLGQAQALLANFNEQAGTAKKVEDAQQGVLNAEKQRAALGAELSKATDKQELAEKRLALLRSENRQEGAGKPLETAAANAGALVASLQAAIVPADALAARAREAAAAHRDDAAALKEAGALLDQNNADNQTAAAQARLYADALGEVVRKIQEATGLDADTISNLRTGNQLREAAVGLTEKQRDALKGYVANLVDARNASDKADNAAEKETKKQADAYDKNLKIIGDTNAKLSDQKVKLDDLKNSNRPNKSQEILDLERQITAELDKQKAAQEALKKIEADRAKAKEKAKEQANPEATKARDEAKADLDSDKLDPSRDYTAQELQARADRRAPLIAKLQEQQRIIDGLGAAPKAALDRADPNFQRLNLGGNPSDFSRDTGALFPTNRPFDPPDTSRDTGPLSDANYEDTAKSRVPAADGLVKAVDGVATAINDVLAPANEKLTTAAEALPGQLATVTTGLDTLYGVQSGHFDILIGLAQTITEAQANTSRDLQTLADYVYRNV